MVVRRLRFGRGDRVTSVCIFRIHAPAAWLLSLLSTEAEVLFLLGICVSTADTSYTGGGDAAERWPTICVLLNRRWWKIVHIISSSTLAIATVAGRRVRREVAHVV